MLDWLARYSDVLSVSISAAMLAVWIGYLQLFLQGYRRERRPKILISRGVGSGLGSRCLLCNMSAEAIYIHSLVARLGSSDRQVFASVTDLLEGDDTTKPNIRDATIQGPVASGGYVDVGTFENILTRAGWPARRGLRPDPPAAGPAEIELTVLATYGSEDLLVGARRVFDITPAENDWKISPRSAETTQIRSRRERRALHRAYMDYLS